MEYRGLYTLWNIEVGIHYRIQKLVHIMENRCWYTWNTEVGILYEV